MQAWEVVYRAFGFFDRKSTASADGPKRKCERKIRNGGILALVAAAPTAAASVAGIVVESSDRATAQFLDPSWSPRRAAFAHPRSVRAAQKSHSLNAIGCLLRFEFRVRSSRSAGCRTSLSPRCVGGCTGTRCWPPLSGTPHSRALKFSQRRRTRTRPSARSDRPLRSRAALCSFHLSVILAPRRRIARNPRALPRLAALAFRVQSGSLARLSNMLTRLVHGLAAAVSCTLLAAGRGRAAPTAPPATEHAPAAASGEGARLLRRLSRLSSRCGCSTQPAARSKSWAAALSLAPAVWRSPTTTWWLRRYSSRAGSSSTRERQMASVAIWMF